MNRAPRRSPELAQVWGCGSLGATQVRAPPFRLSGGLLLPQRPEVRVRVPSQGYPPAPTAPAAAQTREAGCAPAPVRLQWRDRSLIDEPGATRRLRASVRECVRALRQSCRFPVSCHVPCGRGAAPAGSRTGDAGKGRLREADGGVGPRKPCTLRGSPAASRLAGGAAGPRAPAVAASPASMRWCVVKALGAGRLPPCCRPGEAVTWHRGKA